MFNQIKSVLKKFIPPPTDVFNREINRSIKHSENQTKILAGIIKQSDVKLSERLKQSDIKHKEQISLLTERLKQSDTKHKEQISLLTEQTEQLKQTDKQNAKKLSDLVNAVEQLKKENKEYKSKLVKIESDIRLVLIPISILSLESNTIKTQNKQQLEMLMRLIQRLDEDSNDQITQSSQPVESDK